MLFDFDIYPKKPPILNQKKRQLCIIIRQLCRHIGLARIPHKTQKTKENYNVNKVLQKASINLCDKHKH